MLLLSIAALAAAQAYGPDTCVSGYVWREAVENDHVCVTPDQRTQARRDNAQARYRVSLTNKSYGAPTCRQGYVWREADRYLNGDRFTDKVCVPPDERAQAAADNAQRTQRARDAASLPRSRPWSLAPTAVVRTARLPDALRDARYEDDGRLLLVRGSTYMRLFEAKGFAPASALIEHGGAIAATYWPKGGQLITTAGDGVLRFWDVATGGEAAARWSTGTPLRALALAPDGRRLLAMDPRRSYSLWDLDAHRLVSLPAGTDANSLNLSADGSRLSALGRDGPQTYRLPQPEPSMLRSVSTHANFWLGVLCASLALAMGAVVFITRRRALQLLRLAQTPAGAFA